MDLASQTLTTCRGYLFTSSANSDRSFSRRVSCPECWVSPSHTPTHPQLKREQTVRIWIQTHFRFPGHSPSKDAKHFCSAHTAPTTTYSMYVPALLPLNSYFMILPIMLPTIIEPLSSKDTHRKHSWLLSAYHIIMCSKIIHRDKLSIFEFRS